jgi:tetratricopeptide (TPR) repeat protein
MTDKPSPSVLPVFPEGNEPRRRRSPWWKRLLRSIGAAWTRFFGAIADFVASFFAFLWKNVEVYLRGRQLRRLLYGLPALVALSGAAVMAGVLVQAGRYDDRQPYRTRAQQARDGRDLELARICYLRLLRDDKPQPVDMFGFYQTLRDLKQDEQADALLRQLTLWEGTGYAPAHLARARQLLSVANLTPQDVRDAQQHLRQALTQRPEMVEAHALLGETYFRLRDWKDATYHLEKAVQADPMLARLLMVAAYGQGNTESGNLWAKRTIEACRQRLNADPDNTDPNSAMVRLVLVEALMNQKDYEGATKELVYGKQLDPDRQEYPQALAQVCATQLQGLPKDKTLADTAKRWQLVREGLQNDPNNLILLQQLLRVTHGTDATAEQARKRLTELLAQGGQASAVLHMALGLDAYAQGKPEQARVHWERALYLDENLLVAANNVAWLLSHPEVGSPDTKSVSLVAACGVHASLLPAPREPADLNRALQLIDFVLKQAPNNARFRETRGQILVRMGRWNEAVKDLDYALDKLANKGPIHASLAKAYEELGLPDLAEEHRKLAQGAKP